MSILVYRGTNKRVVAKLSRRLFDADWNLAPATRENIAGASLVLTATDGTNTIEVGGSVVDADDGIAEFLITPGHTMALANQSASMEYEIKYWSASGAQEVVAKGTLIVQPSFSPEARS